MKYVEQKLCVLCEFKQKASKLKNAKKWTIWHECKLSFPPNATCHGIANKLFKISKLDMIDIAEGLVAAKVAQGLRVPAGRRAPALGPGYPGLLEPRWRRHPDTLATAVTRPYSTWLLRLGLHQNKRIHLPNAKKSDTTQTKDKICDWRNHSCYPTESVK